MEENFELISIDKAMSDPVLVQCAIEIKAHTGIIEESAVSIGRTLLTAKARLKHGDFSAWVQQNTGLSHSGANNLMNIAKGVQQTPALESFPRTKILALLEVPVEEREQFIAKNDVDKLSQRELKKAIRERDAAKKEAERNAGLLEQYTEKYSAVQAKLEEARMRLDNMTPPEPIEIPVEVLPPDYEEIKSALEREKRRAAAAEAYAEQVDAAYNKGRQKVQQAHMQQIDAEESLADPYSPKELRKAVDGFMGAMGVLPNMTAYFSNIPPERISEYNAIIDTMEAWVKGARAATKYCGLRVVSAQAVVE